MKLAISLILCAVQFVIATPALCKSDQSLYMNDVRAYATCTVRNNHNRARQFILANVNNKTLKDRFEDIYTDKPLLYVNNCRELVLQSQAIIIQPDVFRYYAADVLVNRDVEKGTKSDFAKIAPLTHLQAMNEETYKAKLTETKSEKKRGAIKKLHDEELSRGWLSAYGECVARSDPQTVNELLFSKPLSSGEFSAISKLKTSLENCLVAGKAITFDRYILRGTLAINYYRLAMADQASSTRKTN